MNATKQKLDFKVSKESVAALETMLVSERIGEGSFKVINPIIRLSDLSEEKKYTCEIGALIEIPIVDFSVIANLCCVMLDFKRIPTLYKRTHGIFLYNRGVDVHISEYLDAPMVMGGGKVLADLSTAFKIPETITGTFSN